MKLLLTCCLLLLVLSGRAQAIFRADTLHEIRLRFAAPAWADTLAQWYEQGAAGAPKQFMAVGVAIDGQALGKPAGIRYKGDYSYRGFAGPKKPFRLHFNKFQNQTFQGIRKLNLHNLAGDPSFLREHLSYDLLRQLGLPASRTSFARLYINEVYWGCYLVVEEPEDKLFLQQNFGSDAGNLFEAGALTRLGWRGPDPAAYANDLKLQSAERPAAWQHVLAWLNFFNNRESYDFAQQFYESFEADQYFKALAADVLLNNWDSYAENGHNFFLYDHPTTGKIHWIPWDYNLALWEHNLALLPRDGNSTYPYKPLLWRISQQPALRQAYYSGFCELLNHEFATYPIEAKTAAAQALIRAAVAADPFKFYSTAAFERNRTDSVVVTMLRRNALTPVPLPGLTRLFAQRRSQLRAELAAAGCDCGQAAGTRFPQLPVSIFPSPTTGPCTVYTDERLAPGETLSIQVLSQLGQPVQAGTLHPENGRAAWTLEALAAGTYFLRLSGHGKTALLRVVRQ